MKTKEAAALLRLNPNTLLRFLKEGKINGVRLSKRMIRFSKADIDGFLANGNQLTS